MKMATTEKADDSSGNSQTNRDEKEKDVFYQTETELSAGSFDEIYIPDDKDEFIDPRLKDYPIPLVAKTGMLENSLVFLPMCRTANTSNS